MADTPNASGEPGELYLDAAATESVSPAVIEAMTPFLTRPTPIRPACTSPAKPRPARWTRLAHHLPRHWAPGRMT